MILNSSATQQYSYPIASQTNSITINSSNYTTGSYSVILIVDGIAIDSKTLIIY